MAAMSSKPSIRLNRSHPTPLYQQIKNYLEQEIAAGHISVGEQLPSEKELQEALGVSRITVRQALQEMASEGKIVRVPGKGSFVQQPRAESQSVLVSFSENMRALGFVPSYRTHRVELVEPPDRVRDALQIKRDEEALYLYRILLANELPMAIQECYLPSSFYHTNPELFTSENLDASSMYGLLEQELKIELQRAFEYVEPAQVNDEEARWLGIAPGGLVLCISRHTFARDGRPVEYVRLLFRSDRYRYRVELFRP